MSKADWIKAAQEQKQPELMHMIMTACKNPATSWPIPACFPTSATGGNS